MTTRMGLRQNDDVGASHPIRKERDEWGKRLQRGAFRRWGNMEKPGAKAH
jgi:hypothetical protein